MGTSHISRSGYKVAFSIKLVSFCSQWPEERSADDGARPGCNGIFWLASSEPTSWLASRQSFRWTGKLGMTALLTTQETPFTDSRVSNSMQRCWREQGKRELFQIAVYEAQAMPRIEDCRSSLTIRAGSRGRSAVPQDPSWVIFRFFPLFTYDTVISSWPS